MWRPVDAAKSFALWQQEVRGRSKLWQKIEVEAAQALRRSYHEIYSRLATELARLNAELAERNQQLDSFADIASDDLKEPLRGIRNFSQFVLENSAAQLHAGGVANLQTVTRWTKRMESMLDALLKSSQLSRTDFPAADRHERRVNQLARSDHRIADEMPSRYPDSASAAAARTRRVSTNIRPSRRTCLYWLKRSWSARAGVRA